MWKHNIITLLLNLTMPHTNISIINSHFGLESIIMQKAHSDIFLTLSSTDKKYEITKRNLELN